jgi:hypothetical protein
LAALRAQTRSIATAPRRSDETTAIEVDELADADEPVAGLPPPTTVRILSDEEIARAKQLKQESRNASAFVALDPRRQPDEPQDSDLMAERIALTVASLQRTASLADLDHDAEIARWELRNVHAGGGGAHAIGNALRAGGKAPPDHQRRQATDIGAVDALIATECESKLFLLCLFVGVGWSTDAGGSSENSVSTASDTDQRFSPNVVCCYGFVFLFSPFNLRCVDVSLEQVLGDMSKTIAAMQDRSRDSERRESQLLSTRDETVVAIGESEQYRAKLLVRAARAVEMRDYVTDVLDCLATKEAELTVLEERALGALEARRAARRTRRTVDAVDKWRSIDRDSAPHDIGAIDDNDGGDMDGAQALRQRRREAREARAAAHQLLDADDLDDDGGDGDAMTRDTLADVQMQAATLFDEADEVFRTVGEVCAHFAAWRAEYYEDYARAFAGLSLPALVVPYVRASLLAQRIDSWLASVEQLEQLPFVETMRNYPPSAAAIPVKPEDEPPLLASTMRLLLKDRLAAAVRRTLDLAAPSETVEAFAGTLRALLAHPFASAAAVRRGVEAALDDAFAGEIALIVLPTNALRSTVAGAPMVEFAQAQFRKCARLLHNIFAFAGIARAEQLRERAVGELLNRHLIPFLRNVDFGTPALALAALRQALASVPAATEERVASDLSLAHQLVWMHYQMAQRSPHQSAEVTSGFASLLRHLGGSAK